MVFALESLQPVPKVPSMSYFHPRQTTPRNPPELFMHQEQERDGYMPRPRKRVGTTGDHRSSKTRPHSALRIAYPPHVSLKPAILLSIPCFRPKLARHPRAAIRIHPALCGVPSGLVVS